MALGRAGRPDSRFQMAPTRSAASVWAAFWISRHQFPMVAQTVLLGGHVRVGLEDNLYLEKGVFAPDNAALVEKAARLVALVGAEPATPAAARDIHGLGVG